MTEAARLIEAGCPSGTAVVAEEQTGGQGRHGRKWHSERGAGLYVSVVLRRSIDPVITLALGLATAEAITNTSGLICDLRWPNDVLINGKKCAGILTQLHEGAVVAGIGINVNHPTFPTELWNIATSMRIEGSREYSREALLEALLAAVDEYVALDKHTVLRLFARASSYVYGRRVAVEPTGAGVTEGLDEAGFLRLRKDSGELVTVVAGGVRPCS
jgi:BirA family biotin operon repressor/biotin-[acetyl-CoA-carboxylase] ligase